MTAVPPDALRDPRFLQLAELTGGIQGWLELDAARVLYLLARHRCPTDRAVELGSWKGRSTVWLAAGLLDRGRGRLIAVDTWAGSPNEPQHAELLGAGGPDALHREFLANMARCGVAAVVEDRRTTTRDAALAWRHGCSIGLLHIDAGHEYREVREDFELWSPLVVRGGYIVFDDVPSWTGPARVVSELPAGYQVAAFAPNKWIVQKGF